MPDLLEDGECPVPADFNAWFTNLDGRVAVLEAGVAASLAGYLKADGSVSITAPLAMVSGTPSAPGHLARLTDIPAVPLVTGDTVVVTTSQVITTAAGASVIVSARSDTLAAYVSAQVGTSATISIVSADGVGTPDATPTTVDWIAVGGTP